MFEKWARRRKARRLIETAIEALYLERFDIDALVKELSPRNGRADLIHAYVSIQVAARLTEPISEKDIDYALKEIASSEQLINEPAFETVLDLLRNLAEVYWLNKTRPLPGSDDFERCQLVAAVSQRIKRRRGHRTLGSMS